MVAQPNPLVGVQCVGARQQGSHHCLCADIQPCALEQDFSLTFSSPHRLKKTEAFPKAEVNNFGNDLVSAESFQRELNLINHSVQMHQGLD